MKSDTKIKAKKPHPTKAEKGRRPSSCSADVEVPIRLLRLVVQANDTPENRKALLAIRETALTRSFTAGHSVVKLEHVIVATLDLPNA